MRTGSKTEKIRERIPALLLILLLIALWQAAARMINIPHILPTPVAVVQKTWELRATLFLEMLPSTLLTIGIGWGLAILIGVILAIGMYANVYVEAICMPVMLITQTIPIMCISPLFVVWMGYTLQARVTAVALSTFFSIALNTYQGLRMADQNRYELMQTMGATKMQIFRYHTAISALPALFTALKMTFPWAVVDAAVAEWLGATKGLGYFSKRMISKMDGAAVFAPIIVLCAAAILGTAMIKWFDRKYISVINN